MKPGVKKSGGRHQRPQQVRIIGGQWKRSTLPVADVEGLRPTPDRVRETVFNWIGHLIGGDWRDMTCLDLFAGTGALGFEAASRGAANTILVESSPAALRHLEASKEKLHAEQVTIARGDAPGLMQRMVASGQRFDLIFLDPPYKEDWLPRILPACVPLLQKHGLVYAESSSPLDRFEGDEMPDWLADWEIIRADRAGAVFYYLLNIAK
jgi:16S rRNA (guanine966-N2)-methyltransferase